MTVNSALRDQVLAYLRAQVGPRTTEQVIAAFPEPVAYDVIAYLHSLAAVNLASRITVHGEQVWRAPAVPDEEIADLEAHYATETP